MDQLLIIFKDLHPEIDPEKEKRLFDDGILDSFDIVTLISEIAEEFDVEIPAGEITPENFNSMQGILKLIERLGGNG